ncbi:MAG: type IV pilus secretin PilQ [Betaproteobacteria bacterium]|nr:type IV pilus secretin PilQ [Betaproteobacteria bacterium]
MRQSKNTVNNILRFAIAVFTACALNAHAQSNPDQQNSIQALSVSGAPGGKLVIKVEMKSALANLPAGFTITTPPRIAFDFPNTANGLGKSTLDFNEGDLRNANIVQAGNRTRLVVNLNQMLSYDTQIDGNNLLITLQGKTADAAATGSVSHFAEAKPTVQKHSLRDVDFHRGKNGEGRIQIDLSDADVGIDIKQQGKSLIVDFIKTSLPRNLQRKLDVTDFGTPVEGIDTFVQGDDVRMVIEPKGLWEQAAYQTDNKFIVEIKPLADDPNKLVKSGQAGYAGEKLTLNFQNILVREALYVIGDFINSNNIPMNMIISDTVSGNLTLRLKDVPWDQALDIILQSKGLDKRVNGNVMQIAPRDELAAKEKINLTSNQEISDLEPIHTESFQLSYQKADAVAAMLTNDKQRILSKRGSAVIDVRTNTLFIQDTTSRLEEARKLIKQIDVPVRQVLIEARFVEASDSFNRTLGGKLGYVGPGSTAAAGQGFGIDALQQGQRAAVAGNVALPGAGSGLGGLTLSLFNPTATKTLTLELTASELDGTTKSIASPRVVTADKKAATIKSGVQIPYQSCSATTGCTTLFKDATLSLAVTPQITPDDHVNMDVNVTQDTVGNIYGGVPSINNKQVTTQVLVDNGGTVVIGGVYTQDVTDSVQKVPLFGDIPVLGWFFKNDVKSDNKKELLIFITPKILKESLNLR